jgi:hypothetical protein
MITDYESIFQLKQPWPPADEDTRARLQLYEKNGKLFRGQHRGIWQDVLRKMRGDKSGDLRIVLNFHKLLSRFWSDMVCGEIPGVALKEKAKLDALQRIIQDNLLWLGVQDGIIDYSKNGTNVLKVRFDRRGIIENVPPKYWFPVVTISNIKQITAHIIAYTFPDPAEKRKDICYLKVEIHRPGEADASYVIEHRLYRLRSNKIDSEQLPLDTFSEFAALKSIEPTGLSDFDVIDIQNKPETDQLIGNDDYTDINDILQEILTRVGQNCRGLDKFGDASMYGPPVEEQDPRDGEYRVQGGSRYFAINEGQAPPGMIMPVGPDPGSFTTIDWLMQRLYEQSGTCKVAFDASQAGTALSGTALRLMMARPITIAGGIKLRYDASIKKAIRLCSRMEVFHGLPGAVEIQDFQIDWKDGLPNDPNEEAQKDSTLVTGGVRSAQGLLREKGYSEDQIKQETEEVQGPALPEPAKIELPPAEGA